MKMMGLELSQISTAQTRIWESEDMIIVRRKIQAAGSRDDVHWQQIVIIV